MFYSVVQTDEERGDERARHRGDRLGCLEREQEKLLRLGGVTNGSPVKDCSGGSLSPFLTCNLLGNCSGYIYNLLGNCSG